MCGSDFWPTPRGLRLLYTACAMKPATPLLSNRLMLMVAMLLCLHAQAAVLGRSEPAKPVTESRIAALPAGQRKVWMDYLRASDAQMKRDKAELAAERDRMPRSVQTGTDASLSPIAAGHGADSMPLKKDDAYYAGDEAQRIANNIVSFQIANGGWNKNIDMKASHREAGQAYGPDNSNRFSAPGDFDKARDESWHYMGTLDNDATTTEIAFLARVQRNYPGKDGDGYRESARRGIEYLLRAQFPNGGWPQVWPLEGGYHDAITYNDDAVTDAAELLSRVARADADYAFVKAGVRNRAREAVQRALQCILQTHVRLNGKRTIWAQQHDALTMEPAAARNFEPIALSTGESAHLLLYLMDVARPTQGVREAIEAGVAWLRTHEVRGIKVVGGRGVPGGRRAVADPSAGPLWARYYSLDAQTPIFGDRDKTIHDNMNELSEERRNGYGWYNAEGERVFERYEIWRKAYAAGGRWPGL